MSRRRLSSELRAATAAGGEGEERAGEGVVECVSQEVSGQTCLCQLLTLFAASAWKLSWCRGTLCLSQN